MGMGWVVYFSENFRKLAASALWKGMSDETIILQRSLENSHALPDIDELPRDFSNSDRRLLSAANSLFTQLLRLAVLQCCCTVKRFSAVTFTSHNSQNKIFLSVVKYFSPNSLTKARNLTLSEHFTLGILKDETVRRYWLIEMTYAIPVNTLPPDRFLYIIFLLRTVISDHFS